MNIPIESFIPSGAGLIATVAGLLGIWFKFQNKVEHLEEDKAEMKRQMEALWKWKDAHEKDDWKMKEDMNEKFSQLQSSLMVTNEQFRQILSVLSEIKERIAKLEGRHD